MKSIAVILGWYSESLVSGVLDYAERVGWAVDLHFQRIRRLPNFIQFDGVVCNGGDREDVAQVLSALNCPKVSLTRSLRADGSLPVVMPDDIQVGTHAAEYFMGKGYEYFASYIQFKLPQGNRRIHGFSNALREAYHETHSIVWPHGMHATRGDALHSWLGEQLAALPKPCAIFAETDDHARVLLEVCLRNEIAVPEEVAVLGANNEARLCERSHVPLSSVDVGMSRNGYVAAQHLDALMDGGNCPRLTLIPSQGVVERTSTETQPIRDSVTRQTLHFVRTHFSEPIDAIDVAEKTGQSLSALKRRFNQHVGTSVKTELNRLRLQKAKRLLRNTDLKASEIAGQCGYLSLESFSRFFRQQVGQSIREFRSPLS